MKNLGISNDYFMRYLSTHFTPVVYFVIVLFFIFIIAYSFLSQQYHFSRPATEGMGLTAKIVYHPLEDTTGMIQYYKFEDGSNTRSHLPTILNMAASLSQNQFDATLKTDSFDNNVNQMISRTNSKVGNASLKLDLTRKQYVELPSFDIPEKGTTFALWFKINDNGNLPKPGIMTLFDYSDFQSNIFSYRITAYYNNSTKQIECVTAFSQDNKRSVQNPNFAIDADKWYHFAWTITPDNGGKSSIYINGQLVHVLTSGFTYPVKAIINDAPKTNISLYNNYIGKCVIPVFTYPSITDFYFNGFIDQSLIYNSAYTSSEVFALYNSF
jgi:hypothetical protein